MKIIRPLSVTDSVLTDSNLTEADYSAWNSGTTYAVSDRVIVVSTHSIYESVLGSNLNNDPTTDDGTYWVRVGATNKWKPFDQSINDGASNTGTITYELTLGSSDIVNAVAFFNVSADTIQVVMTDTTDGEVYNTTVSMNDNSTVVDWYAYFFEPIVTLTEYVLTDLPAYAGTVIDITFDAGSNTAQAGEIVPGFQQVLGLTLTGTRAGIRDFSTKTRDAYGNALIVERAFSRTVDFQFALDTLAASQIINRLSALRATPIVYFGVDDQAYATLVYGFYQDFEIDLRTNVKSFCTLTIEGLV
ncbi:MAG: hypothetical protein ACPG4X_19860 [Pikeienuella sp.]